MKTKITIVLSILLSAVVSAQAQFSETPAIKVLPTLEKEVIKVLYACASDSPVDVKFYNEEGVLLIDRIKGKDFEKGFTKRYNLHKINKEKFWVEVSSNELSVTYRMTLSEDGATYQSFLQKTVYLQPLVAYNN